MATYSTNEFRPGLKVLLEGDPCTVVESEFFKPGKGQAMTKVKLRNLKTGRIWERTFRSGESLEAAEVISLDMEYLYHDGEFWHFMERNGSYEQHAVSQEALGDTRRWVKEQDVCEVMLWNGEAISVTAPNFVELEVVRTEPGARGDTAQGAVKPAQLSTGTVIKVPLFVNVGDRLRIDTRTGEYQGRVKGS